MLGMATFEDVDQFASLDLQDDCIPKMDKRFGDVEINGLRADGL